MYNQRMDKKTDTTNLNLTDVPQADLDMIARIAERRGWSRLQTIRHILAHAAARERAKQAAAEVAAKQGA